MEIVNCKAIVLKLSDYRESDRLVTLFTLEHGRISGIARGARRSVKRFGGALELFALLNIQMKFRHALSDLIEADIVTIHSGIRGDLGRIAHAAYASDLVANLAPEGMVNHRLFRLIAAYLDHLNANSSNNVDRRFFEMNLLNILGYRPSLDACRCCGIALGADSGSSARIAGTDVVCRECGPSSREISFEALGFLSRALKTGRFGMLDCSSSSLAEVGVLLDNAIESHLDAPLRSLAFLREIGE
jgi:DNA repair protein RecO (recombination protein O)